MSSKPEEIESKSARKRRDREIRATGLALAALTDAQLATIPLDDELKAALLDYRRIQSHEARRRHAHYIGRLMRRADLAPIEQALAAIEGKTAATLFAHHRLETWRERLIEDDDALTAFLSAFPRTDARTLRALIRRVRADPSSAGHARALFRFLREASEGA
jgi:ribosome-associated protein